MTPLFSFWLITSNRFPISSEQIKYNIHSIGTAKAGEGRLHGNNNTAVSQKTRRVKRDNREEDERGSEDLRCPYRQQCVRNVLKRRESIKCFAWKEGRWSYMLES